MKKVTFACVYRSTDTEFDENAIDSDWQPLRINGQDVRFLIDILRSQSAFHDITENVWRFDFFSQIEFRQVLYVSVIETVVNDGQVDGNKARNDWSQALSEQARTQINPYLPNPREVVRAVFIQTDYYQPSRDEILTASQFIRGTNSMEFDTLERHSDRFIHVDGRGTTLFSPKAEHAPTFKRQVVLLSLAKSYLFAMNEAMNGLATHCDNSDELKHLYKTALIFNARYFFANPVKINRHDAFQLWQGIRHCTMIDDINREIIQQLKSVHQILSEEEETQQMKYELRLNKRVGWLGVGIGMMSLISLFEITPTKVADFVNAWVTYTSGP